MCKDKTNCHHDYVTGKAAVELFHEARILGHVCDARFSFLKKQAMSFHTWLGTQEWCADPTAMCTAICKQIEKVLKEQGPTGDGTISRPDDELNETWFNTMAGLDDFDSRSDDEHAQFSKIEGMYHSIAYKAWKKTCKDQEKEIWDWTTSFCEQVEASEINATIIKRCFHVMHRLDIARHGNKVSDDNKDIWYKHAKIGKVRYYYLKNWLYQLVGLSKQFGDQQELWEEINHSQEEEDVVNQTTIEAIYYTMD